MAGTVARRLPNRLPTIPAPWRLTAPTVSSIRVSVNHLTDTACPWAYSFEPTMRALECRYGDQLELRTTVIGLSRDAGVLERRGYTPARAALAALHFARLGMPFTPHVRDRVTISEPACRLIKSAGLQGLEFEEATVRALRFAQFNSSLLLDEPSALEAICESIEGLDVARAMADLHSPELERAYLADYEEARNPSAIAVSLRRSANTDGRERYTAPSLVLTASDGRTAIVPGFQPFEAADVALMNLEPGLTRLTVPDLEDLLGLYPGGLTSQEVARVLADTTDTPDRRAAESALIQLVASGRAHRTPLGDDALWTPA